jgi:hypothetical protein
VRTSNGKVKQRIVRHIGIAMNEDELSRLMELALYIKTKLEVERTPSLFSVEELVNLAQMARKSERSNKQLLVDLKDLREEQRSIIGIHDVYGGLYDALGFGNLFAEPARNRSAAQLLKHIVMARIANPVSKRASVEMLYQVSKLN